MTRDPRCTWDASDETLVVEMWQSGHSAGQIAKKLGNRSRNSVISKIHRLGMSGRGGAPTRARTVPRKVVPPSKKREPEFSQVKIVARLMAEPLPPTPATDIARVRHDDLEAHHCRWPVGTPGEINFGFCGCRRVPGLSYCHAHTLRAYQPGASVRSRQAFTEVANENAKETADAT